MSTNASAVAVPSLYESFAELKDPRSPHGIRHPLAALLTLATLAMLAGATTLTAMAEFGRNRPKLGPALGFTRRKMPCLGTFHYLFKRLDVALFEQTLGCWLEANYGLAPGGILHLDGKGLCGSRQGALPGIHLLAAYSESLGSAVAQVAVDAKTNEHKAALELLKVLPLEGAIVTGDAAFTQRDLSTTVLAGGGDYVLTVKGNQPLLKQALLDAFDAPLSPSRDHEAQTGLA